MNTTQITVSVDLKKLALDICDSTHPDDITGFILDLDDVMEDFGFTSHLLKKLFEATYTSFDSAEQYNEFVAKFMNAA